MNIREQWYFAYRKMRAGEIHQVQRRLDPSVLEALWRVEACTVRKRPTVQEYLDFPPCRPGLYMGNDWPEGYKEDCRTYKNLYHLITCKCILWEI